MKDKIILIDLTNVVLKGFDSKKGSAEGEELEVFGIRYEKYEDDQFPVSLSAV